MIFAHLGLWLDWLLPGEVSKKLRASGGFEDIMTKRQVKEQRQRPWMSDDVKTTMESARG